MQSEFITQSLLNLRNQLSSSELPLHSLIISYKGTILSEDYFYPYKKTDLHRMFSITKSFCSLAIGKLIEEGKLSLADHITDFFPEYCNETTSPYLYNMTIQDMLSMQTCHTSTTYKVDMTTNWVASFFEVQPSHRSGTIFLYDTSSSHTLAALIKKLTGLGVLDYLRTCFLDKIGFSKEAYILSDPFGSEMGGSGLMARPDDLLKTAHYIMSVLKNDSGPFADYLHKAVSFQVPTMHVSQTTDEKQGYGYQFWRIRDHGFAMYGMGGQYVLFYPQLDLVIVTTADLQNIKGGTQILLDQIHNTIIQLQPSSQKADKFTRLSKLDLHYRILSNPSGFESLRLCLNQENGTLFLNTKTDCFEIPFSFSKSKAILSSIAKYNQRIASHAVLASPDHLYLESQICDECVGSLHFMLYFSDDAITVWMKKVEETYFKEFSGFLEGIRI